jgi:hypothetical protein
VPFNLFTKARTILALGPRNAARVAAYRLRLRAGMHPAQRLPRLALPVGPFFKTSSAATALPALPVFMGDMRTLEYFGWFIPPAENVPDWHCSPFTGVRATDTDLPWWTIPDFDPRLGDIKAVWEASRFDWVVTFAQHARAGDRDALARLNDWLADWCSHNQPYNGHNWKCGQESSLRVLHLAVAALVLGQTRSARPELISLVTAHMRRIAPTIGYALGQDNNHGTSEAAALFVGGSWLGALGVQEGARWGKEGRRWLEERAQRLIEPDGSFSQYSVNYHRLMLDTFSIAEIWRRHLGLAQFSTELNARVRAAAEWLRFLTDPLTGDAPNLGANDGANLLTLTGAGFRDYRPAVQLASALFFDASAYEGSGVWNAELKWLGVDSPGRTLPAMGDRMFPDGGYGILRRGDAMAVFRFPRFRFRPGHADALHLDLWLGGENLLRDGGSFSYADAEWHTYFTGARGHNVVQFDDREQMPRLSRFLWGDWVRTQNLQPIVRGAERTTMAATYRDGHGAMHERRVALGETGVVVSDIVRGFSRRAVLRWRLRPGAWTLRGNTISDGTHRLTVSANVPIVRCELVTGWEARFYLQRTEVPVLEVELAAPGVIVSEYEWVE